MRIIEKTIIVRNLAVQVNIGVHEHEKAAPQRLLVSVEITCAQTGEEADSLLRTLDYEQVCDFIRGLAGEGHFELQETVARRVLAFVLAWPGVARAVVETRKPDIFEDCEFVGVRLGGKPGDIENSQ